MDGNNGKMIPSIMIYGVPADGWWDMVESVYEKS